MKVNTVLVYSLLLICGLKSAGGFTWQKQADPTEEHSKESSDRSTYATPQDPKKNFTAAYIIVVVAIKNVRLLDEKLLVEQEYRRKLKNGGANLEKPEDYLDESERVGLIGGTCDWMKLSAESLLKYYKANILAEIPNSPASMAGGKKLIETVNKLLVMHSLKPVE